MIDLDILPDELKNKSISPKEIVLEYHDALKALEILLNNKWGILGYEVWFKYPEGKSHFFSLDGKPTIDSSESIEQQDKETWDEYIIRSNEYCKNLMKMSYEKWNRICNEKNVEIYYCLTACDK